jgi:hypothetical protein
MKMHETNGALEEMTRCIQFQINKHGHYCSQTSVEDVVNSMHNHELLTMVADYLDESANPRTAPTTMAHAVAEFQEIFAKRYGCPVNQPSDMLYGYLLGKGYSFDEIDDLARHGA